MLPSVNPSECEWIQARRAFPGVDLVAPYLRRRTLVDHFQVVLDLQKEAVSFLGFPSMTSSRHLRANVCQASPQQRIVELPIEHGGLGFLPVKDLAAIARLSALASLPDNPHTHSFREAIIEKEGSIWKPDCNPKWKHLQGRLLAMCTHFLQDAVQKPYSGTSPSPTSPRATRMPGCMLITLSRSSDTVGSGMSTNTLSRRDQGPLAWVIGSMLYPPHHSSKWRMVHSNGAFNTGLDWLPQGPGGGHLCGKQLPGARQPCKAPLDHIGRHVSWCARRAREIRHNRLKDFFGWTHQDHGSHAATQGQPTNSTGSPCCAHGRHTHFRAKWHGHLDRCQDWHGQTWL